MNISQRPIIQIYCFFFQESQSLLSMPPELAGVSPAPKPKRKKRPVSATATVASVTSMDNPPAGASGTGVVPTLQQSAPTKRKRKRGAKATAGAATCSASPRSTVSRTHCDRQLWLIYWYCLLLYSCFPSLYLFSGMIYWTMLQQHLTTWIGLQQNCANSTALKMELPQTSA